MDEEAPSPFATTVDLLMLSLNGAHARTLKDFRILLEGSGFRVDGVTLTTTPVSLVHARAV